MSRGMPRTNAGASTHARAGSYHDNRVVFGGVKFVDTLEHRREQFEVGLRLDLIENC